VDEFTAELIHRSAALLAEAEELRAATAALVAETRRQVRLRRTWRAPWSVLPADAGDRLPQHGDDLTEPVAGFGRLRGEPL
jgi:hypothetical protein